MRFFSDDYHTVVAKDITAARLFFLQQELTDEEGLDEIREVDPDKRKMLFPLDGLPEKYHDENKYPRESCLGEYTGVLITLSEALQHRREEPPYIISVSSDVL